MYKRILVPLDGSTRAESALPVAARLARASGGSVMLAGIKIKAIALFGATAQTILSVASSYNTDLIVMTSRGKTGMKRWVLGSVAQKLARHSPMPVLVLHEAGPMPLGLHPDIGPISALVTLDGPALAKTALEPAAQTVAALATPGHGTLYLLRVVKPPQLDEKKLSPERAAILKAESLHRARTYMESIATHLREGPLGVLNLALTWSVVLDDDVAGAIIHVAETGEDAEGAGMRWRCDQVAMATHGRTGFQHWMLGSLTERVLGTTRLPMLIARPAEAEFHLAGYGNSPFQ